MSPHLSPEETLLRKSLRSFRLAEKESGLLGIPRTYVISLEERPAKWQRVNAHAASFGLHTNRVPAINGWTLSEEVKKELSGPYKVKMNGGRIGCLLSHLSLIQHAYSQGLSSVWIMEDDVEIVGSLSEIPSLLQELFDYDPFWDILYTDSDMRTKEGFLYNVVLNPRPDQVLEPIQHYLTRVPVSDRLLRIRYRYGLHSYLLSRRGMKKIIDYFTHVYLWVPVDVDIHYVPDLKQYVSRTPIVTHWLETSYSDTIHRVY